MRFSVALATLAVAFAATERSILNSNWSVVKRSDKTQQHDVVFAIRQNNLEEVERIAIEVSTPGPKFGKHLSFEQMGELVRNDAAIEAVTSFVKKAGGIITHVAPNGEFVHARAPVSVWESLLDAEFHEFLSATGDDRIDRSSAYTLPAALSGHVDAVLNTVQMPPAIRRTSIAMPKLGAAPTTTPALLQSFYGVDSTTATMGSQSVFESLNQQTDPNDLSAFEQMFNLPIDGIDNVIGGHVAEGACRNPNNCAEFSLDIQYMLALANDGGVGTGVETTTYYVQAIDSFLKFVQDLSAMENPPLVNSISYGAVEPTMPESVLKVFNTEAMKLGARGVSIIVSSGDDGVANFGARDNSTACGYNPSWPASSPWTTAVGATQGIETATEEIICSSDAGGLITSGGGFSSFFPAPEWQKDAIAKFLAQTDAAPGFNAEGAGLPDVSMAGHNYEVLINGRKQVVSGTSASAPVFAALVSLVNSHRLEAGKSPLGFLNPAIYQFADKFANDIVNGNNHCAAGTSDVVCCEEGFNAVPGWDAASGVGSINFPKFDAIFSRL